MHSPLWRHATTLALSLGLLALAVPSVFAASAEELDRKVDATLERFFEEVRPGKDLAAKAAGVLVFPKIIKAGLGLGGETGEGALRVGGETVDYYRAVGGSVGLQFGAQAKTVVLLFMDDKTLAGFRKSDGWKVGVDGSVTLVDVGAQAGTDTDKLKDPILAFVFDQKGLMYNLTLEGSKLSRIHKERPAKPKGESEGSAPSESAMEHGPTADTE